jgi:hypothetical protein
MDRRLAAEMDSPFEPTVTGTASPPPILPAVELRLLRDVDSFTPIFMGY